MIPETELVGHRVISNDSFGFIRYVGPIDGTGTNENWYGIEWDDPSRGKHDGSYKGKKYFQTKHETGGSFVKKNKIDFGVNIYEAAKEKYLTVDIEDSNEPKDPNKDEFIYSNIGFIDKLANVSFAYCKISSLEKIDLVKSTFPSIREIDLDGNLFYSWTQIFDVLNTFTNIRLINVSNNKLALPNENSNLKYENIKYLVMNRLNYNWEDIILLTNYFPLLSQLKVCFNEITNITSITDNIKNNLRVLDLETNMIDKWDNIVKLGDANMLEELYLNNTGLSSIHFQDTNANEKTNLFPQLKSISLNQNKIDNLQSINELNKLNNLEELKLNFNPLNESIKATDLRYLVIAKLEKLKMFNRTKITKAEREECEYLYLKHNLEEYLKATKTEPKNEDDIKKFHHDHPRYLSFIEKYGLPEICEVTIKPDTVKSNLISLSIVNDITKETLVKKIPSTMVIQRLKVVIAKLFAKSNFENDTIKLMYKSGQLIGEEYELENDFRDLKFYSVEDGDIIIAQMKS